MKVCGGIEVGGEHEETADGDEEAGGLDGLASPSPPAAAKERCF